MPTVWAIRIAAGKAAIAAMCGEEIVEAWIV